MPTVKQILDAAQSRSSHLWDVHEASMDVRADMDVMVNNYSSDPINPNSDTGQRMLDVIEQRDDKDELVIGLAKDALDIEVEAIRLIEKLPHASWKRVLTLKYVKQREWNEVAAAMHTTTASVKGIRDRAIKKLEEIVELEKPSRIEPNRVESSRIEPKRAE